MPLRHSLARLIAAISLLLAAMLLITHTGLPNRAEFTGMFVEGLGIVAPEPGAFAPPVTLPMLDGTTATIPTAESVIMLNFWATWCPPCEAELPILQALAEEMPHVQVIAINLGEDTQTITPWLAARRLQLAVALDPTQQVAGQYQVRGQPSTYIITPDGRITHIFYGPVSESALRAALPIQVSDP